MNAAPRLPDEIASLVEEVGARIEPHSLERYKELAAFEDSRARDHAQGDAWLVQLSQERKLRSWYAFSVLAALAVQVIIADVAFFLLGAGEIAVEPWVASSFIISIFLEVAALAAAVLRYLFPLNNRREQA